MSVKCDVIGSLPKGIKSRKIYARIALVGNLAVFLKSGLSRVVMSRHAQVCDAPMLCVSLMSHMSVSL